MFHFDVVFQKFVLRLAYWNFSSLQKYGLKVYLRDPSSYTPLIEPGGKDGKARSLLLGRNHTENMKQIAQFSDKDAQVLGSA